MQNTLIYYRAWDHSACYVALAFNSRPNAGTDGKIMTDMKNIRVKGEKKVFLQKQLELGKCFSENMIVGSVFILSQ